MSIERIIVPPIRPSVPWYRSPIAVLYLLWVLTVLLGLLTVILQAMILLS